MDFLNVLSGVPQGSVLGPLLFLICVDDLSKIPISSSLLLFADDSKCFQVESHSDCSLLQDSLDKALQWSEEWDLAFNTFLRPISFDSRGSHLLFLPLPTLLVDVTYLLRILLETLGSLLE